MAGDRPPQLYEVDGVTYRVRPSRKRPGTSLLQVSYTVRMTSSTQTTTSTTDEAGMRRTTTTTTHGARTQRTAVAEGRATPTRLDEWVCVEYDGWPRRAAQAWFGRRGLRCPTTAAAAQVVAQRAPVPTRLLAEVTRGFARILREYFA